MRDKETIETALLAAATGHLVLSTLHTLNASETVNRIIGYFEHGQQQQVRLQLGAVLKAIISQRLADRSEDKGFVPAVEVLINSARVREMIENPSKNSLIPKAIEEGYAAYGMQTLIRVFWTSLLKAHSPTKKLFGIAAPLKSLPLNTQVSCAVTSTITNSGEGQEAYKARIEDRWKGLTNVELEQINEDTTTGMSKDDGIRIKREIRVSVEKKQKKIMQQTLPAKLLTRWHLPSHP